MFSSVGQEIAEANLRRNMKPLNIQLYQNHVVICGKKIDRPATIAPSQWFDCWEKTQ